MPERVFDFQRAGGPGPVLALVGVTRARARVGVDDEHLKVRFGFCTVTTPRWNVAEATVTGPYRWWRGLGVRVSLADRGLTFGSSTLAGTCIRFREPVRAHLGALTLPLRHPALTVTVDDPAGLAALLGSA